MCARLPELVITTSALDFLASDPHAADTSIYKGAADAHSAPAVRRV